MLKQYITLIVLILLTTIVKAQTLTDSLVVYYPFDGNANDASGHNVNGTIYGAKLTDDKDGNSKSAYSFSGADSIIGIPINLHSVKGLTICMWIKTNDNNGTYTLCQMPHYVMYLGRFKAGCFMAALDGNSSNNNPSDQSDSSVTNNEWVHIAATNDGDSTRLYINGKLNHGYAEKLIDHTDAPYRLRLGTNGVVNNFSGIMDEFRMYTRALSEKEINKLASPLTDAGINGLSANRNTVSVYPTITDNRLINVQFSEPATLGSSAVVTNMAGQTLLKEHNFSGQNLTLNLSGFSKGMYLVRLTSNNNTYVHKVILK